MGEGNLMKSVINQFTRKTMLYAIIIIIPLCSFSQIKPTVAILDFEGLGLTKNETISLSNRFRAEIVKTKMYIVLDRQQTEEILKEQKFQISGCINEQCAIEIGQLLGVQKIITGDIGRVGETYSINAIIVDIETGKTDKAVSRDFKGKIDGLIIEMKFIAYLLSGIKTEDIYNINQKTENYSRQYREYNNQKITVNSEWSKYFRWQAYNLHSRNSVTMRQE